MLLTRPRVVVLIAILASAGQSLVGQRDDRDPDYVAQISTVAAIRNMVTVLDLYASEHGGRFPGNLGELKYKFPEWSLNDGWKRPLYYYSTGTTYILVSYGRSGKPDPQTAQAGGHSAENDYEADIVLINRVWAQSPKWVDRELG